MTNLPVLKREPMSPPQSYMEFIERARCFAESKGIVWANRYDASGNPHPDEEWDLRLLVNGHGKHEVGLGSFSLDAPARQEALAAGWDATSMALTEVLDAHVQLFIKAVVVYRCRKGKNPRGTRQVARNLKVFFSVTGRVPWELTSEDISRYIELRIGKSDILNHIKVMGRVINEHLLSIACPLVVQQYPAKYWQQLHQSLNERARLDRLPEKEALYELARIVIREKPRSHLDRIRLCAIRIILFTGLRLNEVLMLPADCLRWEEHVDVVTGLPANEVGGIFRTLRLRYFAEKQPETAPDLLVEEAYPVPARFQDLVASAVEEIQVATVTLRKILASQLESPSPHSQSDLRRFKTTAGPTVTAADLLFLHPRNGKLEPVDIGESSAISCLGQNTFYTALGMRPSAHSSSLFARYGSPGCSDYAIRPHSLRHLLNTELFRCGVPDTVITQQFGRTTVAQSYEYDHRTLSEKLEFVRLPESARDIVQPGSTQELVAKMVVGGLTPDSHLAKSFVAVQASSGDEAAFKYLVASSDGFHVTPYGFCLNSFSMNPCARHLKCFDKCKHFTASGLPEHMGTLRRLRDQLAQMRQAAAAKPAKTVGRANQVAHADSLLAGVEAALKAQPNTSVFENGLDHSRDTGDVFT